MIKRKAISNIMVIKKGTVGPAGMTNNGGSNYVCTWRIAHIIEGVRDWLFAQKK